MIKEYLFDSQFLPLPAHEHSQNDFLHYVDEGEGEQVLLAVHGNPSWSFLFRHVIQRFKSVMRVIALDHLGCGLSSKPQEATYNLATHIKNLNFLIEKLELKNIHLLLHDWGGAIGMGAALENKDKIKSITLCNTAAFWSDDIPKRIAMLQTPYFGEFIIRALNGFACPATRMAVYRPLSLTAKKGLLMPYRSWRSRIAIARFVQDIPKDSSHPSYNLLRSIESRLSSLTCPKLLLWGMKDFCFHPGFLETWKKIYPEAKVVPFEQAGHYLFEDEASAINDQLYQLLRPFL